MDKYYYLIAQLPLLKFKEQTYLDRQSFLAEAKKWLTDKDFEKLEETDIDNLVKKGKTSLAKKYKEFELNLRKELATYRESKKNKQEYQPTAVLEKKMLEGNPLEVEQKLLYFRWRQIEELSQEHVFDLEAVIAYFLKLQIRERLSGFDKERGTEKFDSLTEVENEKIR